MLNADYGKAGRERHRKSAPSTQRPFRRADLLGGTVRQCELGEKKMVVNALINRIEVSRDYKVKIDFNFDFEQFTQGLDIAA